MKGGGPMKRIDYIIISIILIIGIVSFAGFKIWESNQATGNTYAKITYDNTLIMMIDLETYQYIVYDTEYKDQIDTGRAAEGIFYVPGKATTDMTELYEIDEYASVNAIIGIKLQVQNNSIAVIYQESPKDLCELQGPSTSHLEPIVCLPNQLVIDVYTNLESDQFVPDTVLG